MKSQAVDRGIKLLVVQGRPQGKALLFPPGEHLFGRGAECQIRANSDWVSRQHCLLRVTPDGAFLRDLGSRNGTLVNGERLIGERRLQPGDQLQVGPLVFQFCPDDTPTPEPLPALRPDQAATEPSLSVMETAEQPIVGIPPANPSGDSDVFTMRPPSP
ncbi:MAG TPA: FHA domain-containing protein [Gemmataceae bacterium]|nr:FHA domain-containing protein [Gemmataceae bacterium]